MAAPARRTRSGSLAATAVAAVLLFLLSGCVKLSADFQVDAEENLTGTMEILVDPVALEDMGSPDPSQELDDAVQEAQADPEVPEGATVERADDEDGYIGMRVMFDAVPASELQSGGGALSDVGVEGIQIESSDGEITFSMTNPLVEGMDSGDPYGSTSGMRSMFDEAVVAVTFPGSVVTAEGAEVDGNTATWNLREYDGDTLSATGDTSSFPWVTALIVAGVLVFLLIAAGIIVLIVVLRRKKAGQAGGSQQMMPAGAPGVMGPGQYPGGHQPQSGPQGHYSQSGFQGQPGLYGPQGQPGGPGQPAGPPGQPGGPSHLVPQAQPGPYGHPGPPGPGPQGPGAYGQQSGGAPYPPAQGAPNGGDDARRFAPPKSAAPQTGQDPRRGENPRQNPPPGHDPQN